MRPPDPFEVDTSANFGLRTRRRAKYQLTYTKKAMPKHCPSMHRPPLDAPEGQPRIPLQQVGRQQEESLCPPGLASTRLPFKKNATHWELQPKDENESNIEKRKYKWRKTKQFPDRAPLIVCAPEMSEEATAGTKSKYPSRPPGLRPRRCR